MLPNDPCILLSYVNTKLRDQYPSLAALCADLDADEADLCRALAGLDYRYDPVYNQFI
ncbi:DUF4250 domain-containing protein [Dysosmobacter sp.]|jgi:hypothetical protein|uniref:DUF4250 domain-containing protein n=1 Tax=Dysosmobacter sp. TaxID=2591382 RepID=UPI001BB474B6|nr:DUF4250 domain-containing protein [Dysosmobacter sp.]MCI6054200.1 DUF4250 domain-containing protein [Dysosmobacter sp.]MDY5509788.1 DUF4250 domain-containing protein [Dysosmobacter sp.]QUO38112.1 DUF4250 domain-containing protein [Dysosmobacter sp. Marseille-Q4140]